MKIQRQTFSSQSFRIVLVLALAAQLLACASGARAGGSSDQNSNGNVDGSNRTALLHVPDSLPSGASVPLVIAYHGHGGDADSMVALTNFDQCADTNGFIVVYPQAINRRWMRADVAFTNAIIDQLSSQYKIDPKRIYATGMSAGALMSEGLGVALATRLAAIAPVAGSLQTRYADAGLHGTPISVIEFHGDQDPLVPFTGGEVMNEANNTVIGAEDTAKAWAALDGCGPAHTSHVADGSGRDKTSVDLEDYGTGTSGCAVELYIIRGGGHAWPGGSPYLKESLIGKTTNAISATDLIWQFFKAHPKP